MVSVRTLSQVAGEDLTGYQDALHREWLAANDPLPGRYLGPCRRQRCRLPWQGIEDAARRPTSASGATNGSSSSCLPARWSPPGSTPSTGFGGYAGEFLTLLFSDSPVLMSKPPAEAPLRLGVYSEVDEQARRAGSAPARLVGWAPVPEDHELRVRTGGLLWPEARERIAHGAWVARERVGDGQVILFAHEPAFRAAQLGAMRILENALILRARSGHVSTGRAALIEGRV